MNPTWIIFVFITIESYIIIFIFFNERALEGLHVALVSIRQAAWVSHQTGCVGVTLGNVDVTLDRRWGCHIRRVVWVLHHTGSVGVTLDRQRGCHIRQCGCHIRQAVWVSH